MTTDGRELDDDAELRSMLDDARRGVPSAIGRGSKAESPATFAQLQRALGEWQRRNFPNARRLEPIVGIAEEMGEAWDALLGLLALGKLSGVVGAVCHAALKHQQGIRGTPAELREKLVDAIGDLMIFAVNACNLFDLDLQEIVDRTWATVSKRDWRADPAGGGTNGK